MELRKAGNKYEMTLTEPSEVDAVAHSIVNIPKNIATLAILNEDRAALVERALEHGASHRGEPFQLSTDETSLALHALEVAKSRIESRSSKCKNPYSKDLRPVIISLVDGYRSEAFKDS